MTRGSRARGRRGVNFSLLLVFFTSRCTIVHSAVKYLRTSQPKGNPPTPRETWENFGETIEVGWEKWRARAQRRQSETRKDIGKVTMESL